MDFWVNFVAVCLFRFGLLKIDACSVVCSSLFCMIHLCWSSLARGVTLRGEKEWKGCQARQECENVCSMFHRFPISSLRGFLVDPCCHHIRFPCSCHLTRSRSAKHKRRGDLSSDTDTKGRGKSTRINPWDHLYFFYIGPYWPWNIVSTIADSLGIKLLTVPNRDRWGSSSGKGSRNTPSLGWSQLQLGDGTGAKDNALSPARPAKERLAVGARVRVTVENEDKEGLYFDDDRVPWQRKAGEAIRSVKNSFVEVCGVHHGKKVATPDK